MIDTTTYWSKFNSSGTLDYKIYIFSLGKTFSNINRTASDRSRIKEMQYIKLHQMLTIHNNFPHLFKRKITLTHF